MTPHDGHDRDLGVVRQGRPGRRVARDTTTGAGDRDLTPHDRTENPSREAGSLSHAAASRQDARAVLGRPLPVAQLADTVPESKTHLVVTRMDQHGRLADRTPLLALRWLPAQRVTFAADSHGGVLLVRRGGLEAITGQGHLRVPARVRHVLRLTAGERLLVAAFTQHDLLIVHTMAAVDAMMLAYHANITRRDAS